MTPQHPYTIGLLGASPEWESRSHRLTPIDGRVPLPSDRLDGCRFAPRCPFRIERCAREIPPLVAVGAQPLSLASTTVDRAVLRDLTCEFRMLWRVDDIEAAGEDCDRPATCLQGNLKRQKNNCVGEATASRRGEEKLSS